MFTTIDIVIVTVVILCYHYCHRYHYHGYRFPYLELIPARPVPRCHWQGTNGGRFFHTSPGSRKFTISPHMSNYFPANFATPN